MKRHLLIIIALFCVLTGCKLDDTGLPDKSTSYASGLLSGIWYIKTQIQTDPVYGASVYSTFTKNDYFMFNSDNTVKVSLTFPATVQTSHYNYDAGSKKIIMGDVNDPDIWTVNKLTTDSLIMTVTTTASAGGGAYHLRHITI